MRIPFSKFNGAGLLGIGVLALLLSVGKVVGALMLGSTSLIGLNASFAGQPVLFIAIFGFWTIALVLSFVVVKNAIAAMGTRRQDSSTVS
jgi:hypothetical protein